MSSLSSSSTTEQVKAAYDDNVAYDLDNSVTKCKAFIEAARILLRRMAEEIQSGDNKVRDNYEKIQSELEKAERWWKANDSTAATSRPGGQYRHVSLADFRD